VRHNAAHGLLVCASMLLTSHCAPLVVRDFERAARGSGSAAAAEHSGGLQRAFGPVPRDVEIEV
jgi:hypothetical protein